MLPRSQTGVPMRYKVGAEQVQRVPSLAHRPDRVFGVARTAPVGPTHAVCATTGATVCGIEAAAVLVKTRGEIGHAAKLIDGLNDIDRA